MRLNAATVAKLDLPPGKSEKIYFDDALPGFGMRLRAGGKRVWIAQYRIGKKQRRVTIGSVDRIGADIARSQAKALLAKVQLGADPQHEKVEARAKASVTLGAVADRYIEGTAKERLRPNSYAALLVHFSKHWKPLRERPLHSISRADIAMRMSEIAKESGPYAANRARASLSSLFSWSMREGIADANPVAGTGKATEEVSRDRVLSDEELAAVWNACRDDDYGRIVRLLILTGQRRDEVGSMSRHELDLAKAMWTIPRERTKNGLAHEVPLSPAALEIINAVPEREGRDLLFGSGEGAFQGWSRAKAKLSVRVSALLADRVEETGRMRNAAQPWRLHDIRRTVATRLGDLGILPHVVEAVLNHVSGHRAGVAGIYNRAAYAKEKREALHVWADAVTTLGSRQL